MVRLGFVSLQPPYKPFSPLSTCPELTSHQPVNHQPVSEVARSLPASSADDTLFLGAQLAYKMAYKRKRGSWQCQDSLLLSIFHQALCSCSNWTLLRDP